MIPLLVRLLVIAGIAAWILVVIGAIPSPFSRTTILIRNGQIRIRGADLSPRARDHVVDVIREAHLPGGFITVSSDGRVGFSRSIPETLRQRLRNILLN